MFYNEIIFFNNTALHIRFARNFAVEKISDLLQAKGLNPEVAISRARAVFGEESEKASLFLHNLQTYFDKELMQKVYDFIAHKALFQEQMQFNSYDQILRLRQHVCSSALSAQELKQLKHISQANRYGIALVR